MLYPEINPVAFHIGSWPIYWYGLMYLFGILAAWGLLSLRLKYNPNGINLGITQEQLSDIIFYAALGVIIGGRVGYILFYNIDEWLASPLLLFQVWKGGMSFHGGLIGVLIAMWILAYQFQKTFLQLTDFISPVVPIGLALGRIGNFINGELWGRVTDIPWAMVFAQAGPEPRHPSQLYESALEGIILFFILWFYSRKPRPLGAVSGLFALGYGVFRSFVEFYREPDVNKGFIAFNWLTEGQLLSFPLIIVGLILIYWAYTHQKTALR